VALCDLSFPDVKYPKDMLHKGWTLIKKAGQMCVYVPILAGIGICLGGFMLAIDWNYKYGPIAILPGVVCGACYGLGIGAFLGVMLVVYDDEEEKVVRR